jgi:DNA-directed RNA polymerase subunit K/omega
VIAGRFFPSVLAARPAPRGAATPEATVTDENVITEQAPDAKTDKPALSPLQSRFLFVDIAALRAKQLRRGAVPRLEKSPDGEPRADAPKKPERIAMEEVRHGLISFNLPDLKPPTGGPLS